MIVYVKNVTWKEAMKKVKELRGRILTNREIDSLTQQDILNSGIFPLWTGTHIEYKNSAETALIWNDDEKKMLKRKGVSTVGNSSEVPYKTKINLPLNDGWYLPDEKYCIPNGAESKSGVDAARFLYRWQDRDYVGLLVRGCGCFGDYRRDVGAVCGGCRFGVLIDVKDTLKR